MSLVELQAIRDALAPHDPEEGADGQDYDGAQTLADAYVRDNAHEFVRYQDFGIEQAVRFLDTMREAGSEYDVLLTETWILYSWPPQQIGGKVEAVRRNPADPEGA